jgi:hypothetical protein
MMSTTNLRTTAVLAVTGALLLAAFAAAPAADASTIYVCAKKSNGAVRIVGKNARCKKGESKMSWNTEGPAGKNGSNGAAGPAGATGAPGANGKEGANGAVAGYSAAQSSVVNITSGEEVVEKTLPAGDYLISAKVETFASATSDGFVAVWCELYDAGTEADLDEAAWTGGLAEYEAGKWGGGSTLPVQTALDLSSSTKVQVWRGTSLNRPSAEVVAAEGKISAVKTSSNS